MTLKFTDMHVVYCGDLDTFVESTLGHRYNSLSAAFEKSQYTYDTVDTTRKPYSWDEGATVQQWLDFDRSVVDTMEFRWDWEKDTWLENNVPTPDPETMIRYLADSGHIPQGQYLIQFWW